MADIVEKLKEACVIDRHYGKSVTLTLDYDDYMDAADTITALRAENEKLRVALEMFACDCVENDLCKFPHACRNYVARAALGGKDG